MAGVIGLLAGVWGRLGLFRSRRGESSSIPGAVVAIILVGALAVYTYARAYASPTDFQNNTGFDPTTIDQSRIFFLVILVVFVALIAVALFLRRDVGRGVRHRGGPGDRHRGGDRVGAHRRGRLRRRDRQRHGPARGGLPGGR